MGDNGWREIIYASIEVHFEPASNGKKGELYATFSRGEVHFRDPLLRLLGKPALQTIESTAPKNKVRIKISRRPKATTYSIHPDVLEKWAEEIKKVLNESSVN